MVVELAVDDLLGGCDDVLRQLGVKLAEFEVCFGGGALDDAQGANDGPGLLFPADLEVAEAALGLGAPVDGGVDLDGAEGVGFSGAGPSRRRSASSRSARHRPTASSGSCRPRP